MQQWELEQENARLQKKIEDQNKIFVSMLQRKDHAATQIQRAFRRYQRFKKLGADQHLDFLQQPADKKGGPIISPLKIKRIPAQQINFNSSYNQSQWKLRTKNEGRNRTPRNEIKIDRSFPGTAIPQAISKTPRNAKEKFTSHFLEAFDFGEANLEKTIPKHAMRLDDLLKVEKD